MTDLEILIGTYGFPIAITIWLLYERASFMKDFRNTLEQNTQATTRLIDKLDYYHNIERLEQHRGGKE